MPVFNLSKVDAEDGAPLDSPAGEINWSPQQLGVFGAVEDLLAGSLRVDAVAGAGKTTCLVEASKRMQGRVAFTAFNKRIADEIKSRVRTQPNMTCGTLHAFGLKAWKNTAPGCIVEPRKLDSVAHDLSVPFWAEAFTKFLVSQLKLSGVKARASLEDMQLIADHHDAYDKLGEGWDDGDRDPFEYVNAVLQRSIDTSDAVIDFDDMLYMPLMYGTIEPEFDWVLIDEAQDTNRTRRMLVERLVLPDGRVVAVGDEHQAIYGFTGADANAMNLIESQFQCQRLPLTITYRCPKRIVEHARQWVSHIEAAPTAPDGVLGAMSADEFAKLGAGSFTARDVILCRNTRPVVSLALSLIRRGIGARVEGREIGQSLTALVTRWKTVNTYSKLIDKLENYQDRETQQLLARGQRAKASILDDKVSSLIAVIHSLPPDGTIYDLKSRITNLFGDTEPGQSPRVCTLSTVHKAKGREWDRVYLLGREQLMPSRYARQEWELQQEKNLIYVAVTRAKRELVEVEYVG